MDTQRNIMRIIYNAFHGNREVCVWGFAEAERVGEVRRRSNVRNLSAEDYAERLFDDGVRKGWLS
jgi:hypothetical protein